MKRLSRSHIEQALLIAGLSLLLALAWAGPWQPAEPVYAPLRIGYSIEAPYAFLDGQNRVTGESPEIARDIAARLGIHDIEWRLIDFGELIPALQRRDIDVIASGLYITAERTQRVAFSYPTSEVFQALLVSHGNPLNLHSYADAVRVPGARIAFLSGAVEQQELEAVGAHPTQLLPVPDVRTGMSAVSAASAIGLAISFPTAQWLAQQNPQLVENALPFVQRPWQRGAAHYRTAFAFRRDDTALLTAWNLALADYLGSATHQEVVARFGMQQAMITTPIEPQTALSLGEDQP